MGTPQKDSIQNQPKVALNPSLKRHQVQKHVYEAKLVALFAFTEKAEKAPPRPKP